MAKLLKVGDTKKSGKQKGNAVTIGISARWERTTIQMIRAATEGGRMLLAQSTRGGGRIAEREHTTIQKSVIFHFLSEPKSKPFSFQHVFIANLRERCISSQ